MKTNPIKILVLTLLTLFVFQLLTKGEDICFDTYSHVISLVETNHDNMAVGRSGEMTKYQFMEPTWNQYSKRPMTYGQQNEQYAEKVFRKHFQWKLRALRTLNKEVSVYNLALLHNAGYGNIQRNTLKPRHYDYASRVRNLFELQY